MGHFLKVFIEFVTILLLWHVLVFWLWGMWDLRSPTRDRTHTLWIERWRLHHWTAREALPRPFCREPSDRYFIKVAPATLPSTCSCFTLTTLSACSMHEVLCPCLLLSRWPLWTQGGTTGQRLDWLHPGPIFTQSLRFNPPGRKIRKPGDLQSFANHFLYLRDSSWNRFSAPSVKKLFDLVAITLATDFPEAECVREIYIYLHQTTMNVHEYGNTWLW